MVNFFNFLIIFVYQQILEFFLSYSSALVSSKLYPKLKSLNSFDQKVFGHNFFFNFAS